MCRVAFCGASGTGKSTLAEYAREVFGLPLNPVGARSVAKSMGFDSPYDVDKAGRRVEFQSRLLGEKLAWEAEREAFVTDRTVADNLAYTVLHNVGCIDEEMFADVAKGMRRYTHIVWCHSAVFCNTGSDPARVHDMAYHKVYEAVLGGLLSEMPKPPYFLRFGFADLSERKRVIAGLQH